MAVGPGLRSPLLACEVERGGRAANGLGHVSMDQRARGVRRDYGRVADRVLPQGVDDRRAKRAAHHVPIERDALVLIGHKTESDLCGTIAACRLEVAPSESRFR